MRNVSILIPAYKPDERLVGIVAELKENSFDHIVVVDDGGGNEYSAIFKGCAEAGADVVTHAVNMGKGRALKTGFNEYYNTSGDSIGIITMDADGQHKVEDVVRVAETFSQNPDKLIMGARQFVGKVPLRSRFGNGCTKFVYRIVSGRRLSDTQTGLRAFPKEKIPYILKLSGERYEFEMSMLMELKNMDLDVVECPIETVYENNNEGSHFNTLLDSWLVYKVILGFIASSVISFMVDYILFAYLVTAISVSPESAKVLIAEVAARLVSSVVNFICNRKALLNPAGQHDKVSTHLIKYYILAVIVLAADYGLIQLFSTIGVSVYVGKLIAGVVLYIINFLIQKRFIFK